MIEEGTTILGIDVGTSHCTAAVWDSTRGHPKSLRLGSLATPQTAKDGRIVPSVVLLATQTYAQQQQWSQTNIPLIDVTPYLVPVAQPAAQGSVTQPRKVVACVGQDALRAWRRHCQKQRTTTPTAALITSAKRLLGCTSLQDMPPELQKALALHLVMVPSSSSSSNNDDDSTEQEVAIAVRPLGWEDEYNDNPPQSYVAITPTDVTSILLQAIREAAQSYLQRPNVRRKHLQIPRYVSPTNKNDNQPIVPRITNVVVGIPAQYSPVQQARVVQAARQAGFTGRVVTTLVESTAAAMAYGIFVHTGQSNPTTEHAHRKILVLDSGGGTTDVTIATLTSGHRNDQQDDDSQRFHVVVTHGDAQLGGDDMDAALLAVALDKVGLRNNHGTGDSPTTPQQRQLLLSQIRTAKERLCGDVDHGVATPEASVTVQLSNMTNQGDGATTCSLTQDDLQRALKPWLLRAKIVIQQALQQFAATQQGTTSTDTVRMDEVILVGGATRVPAVRQMVRELFPPPIPSDLCLSVDAMAAVAQGTAIQAAVLSGTIPYHEIRSAMMLDTVPHAIGILVLDHQNHHNDITPPKSTPQQQFIEIMPRDAPLPATGSAHFALADATQPGISFTVVEDIGTNKGTEQYPKLGEFSFLLARLSSDRLNALPNGIRSVEVILTLTEHGALVVSYFDENDPEHRQKKAKQHPLPQHDSLSDQGQFRLLDVRDSDKEEEGFSSEQMWLLISCIVLFVAYIVARIAFQEELAAKSESNF